MSYDESGDFTYNPFAEDNDCLSEPNPAQGYSSSSVPKLSNPLSLNIQNSIKGSTDERGKEIGVVPESAGCLHPLKSALARQNDTLLYDLGVTRPHLSRIINEKTLIKDKSSEQDDTSIFKTPSPSDEETEVIVHDASFIKPSYNLYSLLTLFKLSGHF